MRSLLVAPFLALWMLPAQAEDLPAQAEVLPGHRLQAPGPLAARPFALPAAQTATLSNGLDVLVVEILRKGLGGGPVHLIGPNGAKTRHLKPEFDPSHAGKKPADCRFEAGGF